jgi:hypothetical protein
MNAKNPNERSNAAKPEESPAPRKRFRIEKLEERIAPKKGGKGTNNCSGGGGSSATDTIGSVSVY